MVAVADCEEFTRRDVSDMADIISIYKCCYESLWQIIIRIGSESDCVSTLGSVL